MFASALEKGLLAINRGMERSEDDRNIYDLQERNRMGWAAVNRNPDVVSADAKGPKMIQYGRSEQRARSYPGLSIAVAVL